MSQTTIIKSQNDKRDYRAVQLPNELTCLLVSDKEADKSSASLDVNIGSVYDPVDRFGLAHFLEHMLFMGTEKFPVQNEYAAYISANSGRKNAATSLADTYYYFDCSNEGLYGALDRFSQFFAKPLFDPSCVEREVNAVDSEYQKNVMQDARRKYQLFRNSAKEGHPYNKFSTGNKATLDLPNIRDDLLNFYHKFYSSNLMKLVIYGKEDLDTLEKWAKEFFSDVKNNNVTLGEFTEMPYTEENLKDFWRICPVDDKDTLEIVWILKSLHPHYKNNPASYISHLVGHEGENSLLSYLIDEGLALGVTSSHGNDLKLFTKFTISITLTKKGLAEHQRVCKIVFQYLKMLKSREPERWIFEEVQKINKIRFDFKDKEQPISYTQSLSILMQYYPLEDVLRLHYMMEEFKPDLIKSTIDNLTYKNMRITLLSKSIEGQCDKQEKWYGTKYTFEPISQDLLDAFENPDVGLSKSGKKLDLPPVNHFIPENLEIFAKEGEEVPKYPKLVYTSERTSVWHKQDNTFRVPKARMNVKMYCTDHGFGENLKTYRLIKLWMRLLRESLRETLYLAEQASLYVGFETDSQGIDISIMGFNDSISKLAAEVFKKAKEFDPTPYEDLFHDVLRKTIKDLKNFFKHPPYQQTSSFRSCLLRSGGNSCHPEEEVTVAESVTFDDVLEFNKKFFRTVRTDNFFIGNITEESAVSISKELEEIIGSWREKSRVLPKELVPEIRIVDIPAGSTWVFEYPIKVNESGDKESNSATVCSLQYKKETPYDRVLLSVLGNYLHDPSFDTLRTNEQLGYIVLRGEFILRGVLHYQIQVQSSKKGPQFLSQRILAFLDSMKEKITNISDEEFKKFVESVRVKVAQKDLSILQEGGRYWDQVVNHRYEFDRKENNLEMLNQLKKEDLIELFNSLFFTNRKLLEVQLVSPNHVEETKTLREERLTKESETKMIQSMEQFKRMLPLYPDFYAYLD